MSDFGGVGGEIGDGGGDGFQGGLEDGWQGEERAVEVEGWEGRAIGHDLLDGELVLEEADERFGALDEDAAASLGDQRSVADELDGVAEALFGVEEDGLAVER